jgi:ADP-heptose:LPS heptosyltransferase
MQRQNPGQLFLWRTPFEPVVRPKSFPSGASGREVRNAREQAIFLGFNLLGDFLCTTPVLRSYRRAHHDHFIAYVVHSAGYSRLLDGNPDVDLVLYSDDLYERGEQVLSEEWLRRLPIEWNERSTLYRFNIHEVCRSDPFVFRDHISWGFARYLGLPIDSVRPVVVLTEEERSLVRSFVRERYVVFGMHSTSKMLDHRGELVAKDWLFERWLQLADRIRSWGDYDIVAVGSEFDPQVRTRHFRNLYGLPIKLVAALLERAACVVTVEGGLSHLCHAVDAPMVVIFSNAVEYAWAFPREATCCRVLYDDTRLISCDDVAAEVAAVLSERTSRS